MFNTVLVWVGVYFGQFGVDYVLEVNATTDDKTCEVQERRPAQLTHPKTYSHGLYSYGLYSYGQERRPAQVTQSEDILPNLVDDIFRPHYATNRHRLSLLFFFGICAPDF